MHSNFCIHIAQMYTVTPQLLNQINNICETENFVRQKTEKGKISSQYSMLKSISRSLSVNQSTILITTNIQSVYVLAHPVEKKSMIIVSIFIFS